MDTTDFGHTSEQVCNDLVHLDSGRRIFRKAPEAGLVGVSDLKLRGGCLELESPNAIPPWGDYVDRCVASNINALSNIDLRMKATTMD